MYIAPTSKTNTSMEAYREIIALAISTIEADRFSEKYLVKRPFDGEDRYYLPTKIQPSANLKTDAARISKALDEAAENGILIKNGKMVLAKTGSELTGDTILAMVMALEKIHTPYLASFKILGFDYNSFMIKQLSELKETLTASDFSALGVQPTRTKNIYIINDDKDNPIKITPGRNGGNAKWLQTKTGVPIDGFKGNMFGLYEYLTQHKGVGRSLNDKIKDCYRDLKNGISLSQSISNEIRMQSGLPLQEGISEKTSQIKLFSKPSVLEMVKHPEIPHKPLQDSSRYLRYRGITLETIKAEPFKDLLGTELSIMGDKPEKMNYRHEDAIFKPLYFVYKDIDGRIINKEFKNYYTRKALKKLREKDPTEKRSFPRHTGPRAYSLFISNIPKDPSHIVLIESPLDCLSFYQYHKNKPGYGWIDKAVFIANGGSMSETQIPIIDKIIAENKINNVMLASDKDMQGRSYNLTYLGVLGAVESRFRIKHKDGEGTFIDAIDDKSGDLVRKLFNQLEAAKLKGGVTLVTEEASASIRFFYTEENYLKVGQQIAQVRKETELKFRTISPSSSKDWTDLLIGKKGEEPLLGNRPLVSWIRNREKFARVNQLQLKEIQIGDMGKQWSIAAKGEKLGKLDLETMRFTPYSHQREAFVSEQMKAVRQEIKKVVDFYSQGIDNQAMRAAQTETVRLDGDILLAGNNPIAKKEGSKIILSDDIVLSEAVEDRLDLMQKMQKGLDAMEKQGIERNGIDMDSILVSVGNKVFLGESGKYHLFNVGIDMNFNPTPLYNNWSTTKHPLVPVVDKLLVQVKGAIPEKEFVSLVPNSEVVVKNEELYWNGKLGKLDEHSRFELFENRLRDNIPTDVYEKIEEFQKLGAEEYKRRVNYEKRIRVDVDMNLLIDKKVLGKVSMDQNNNPTITLPAGAVGLAELLVKAGLQPGIISIGDQKYEPVKETTKSEVSQRRVVRLEQSDGSMKVMVGDMVIGSWDAEAQKIELDKRLGTPNESIAKEIEKLELEQREKRMATAMQAALVQNPENIVLKTATEKLEINASACPTPEVFAVAVATQLREDEQSKVVSAVTDDKKEHNTLEQAWNSHAEKHGKQEMSSLNPLSPERLNQTDQNKESDIWLKGTCILKDVLDDPKWKGILIENEQGSFIKGHHNRELKPIYDLGTFSFLDSGFVRTNIADRIVYHESCVIAQDVQALMAYYQLNRDTIAYDDKVSLFAPADPGSLKLCVLSAALLKPKTIVLIGDKPMAESLEQYKNYLSDIEIKRISEGEVIANFHQEREKSARPSNPRYDILKNADLPGALFDDSKKEVYLPTYKGVLESGRAELVGTLKIVPGENTTALIATDRGVYIPRLPTGVNDPLFVSGTINNEFIERTKAGDFTLLAPQKNNEMIDNLATIYSIPKSNIIKIDDNEDPKMNYSTGHKNELPQQQEIIESKQATLTF
jgi:hypothetical protein